MSLQSRESSWFPEALIGGGITSSQATAFKIVWDHGGYIAGGFARMVAALDASSRGELNIYPVWRRESSWRALESYTELVHAAPPHPSGKASTHWKWRGAVGDVDFFFPNEVAARAALGSVMKAFGERAHRETTAAGYAEEVTYDQCRYQFITRVNGALEDVLSGFDLTNAKVALLPESILTPPEWLELEEARAIGIDLWSKPNLLWRVKKWASKHLYRRLRTSDEDRFVNLVFDAFEAVKDGTLKRWDRPITKHEVQRFVKMFIYSLEPGIALKASMLLDDYDRMNVVKDVMNRGTK
jgi:hypothetical protein